jgi:hypothetical protein
LLDDVTRKLVGITVDGSSVVGTTVGKIVGIVAGLVVGD